MNETFKEYACKILAGVVILLIRYIEKTNLVKHYKKKLDKLLNIDNDEKNNN